MKTRTRWRGLGVLVLVGVVFVSSTVAVGAAVGAFDPQPDPPGRLGPLGIVQGQTLRVNVSNIGDPDARGALACEATVEFLDPEGNALDRASLKVDPGQGASTDLIGDSNLIGDPDLRLEVRAVVQVDTKDCPAVASMELFDTETERTQLFIGDPNV